MIGIRAPKHAFGPQPFDLKPFAPQPIGPHLFNPCWKFGTQIYIAIALVQVIKVPWVPNVYVPNVWVPNVWVMCTKYPGTKYPSTIIKVMSGNQMVEGQKGWLPRG